MRASSVTDRPVWPARLDVKTKMAVCAGCALFSVFLTNLWAHLFLFSVSSLYLVSTRRVRVILGAYAMMALMMGTAFLCAKGLAILVPALGKGLSLSGIAVPFLRGATMMNVVLPLAFTSRVQNVLASLRSLRLPFFLYVPAAVMIRFIPAFTNDIRQIAESLRIRGFRISAKRLLSAPGDTVRCLFAPLVVRALRSADDLGVAAELKGIAPGTRASRAAPKTSLRALDRAFLAASVLAASGAVLLQFLAPVLQKGGMP